MLYPGLRHICQFDINLVLFQASDILDPSHHVTCHPYAQVSVCGPNVLRQLVRPTVNCSISGIQGHNNCPFVTRLTSVFFMMLVVFNFSNSSVVADAVFRAISVPLLF